MVTNVSEQRRSNMAMHSLNLPSRALFNSNHASYSLPLALSENLQHSTNRTDQRFHHGYWAYGNARLVWDEEALSHLPTTYNSAESTQATTAQPSRSSSVEKKAKVGPPQETDMHFRSEDIQYHIFGHLTLTRFLGLFSLCRWQQLFSPLSSNIYFPVLDLIADDLETSNSAFTLSVSIYMIAQGIAPSFWGTLADTFGRRQVLIYTLLFYVAANIGLALASNFSLLMVFRFLQAAGSSSTISIGAGVIADIAPPAEGGGFIGTFSGMRQFALAIGPVLGGVIGNTLGYHWIFWFLVILGAFTVLTIAFYLAETLRRIAGNGSVQLTRIQHQPLYKRLWSTKKSVGKQLPIPPRQKLSWRLFLEPLVFLLEKDVACTLFFGGVVYTVWSMVTSSTSVLLSQNYHLNVLQIGLCFIPNGIGCVIGSTIAGRQLDRDFKAAEESYQLHHGDTTLSKHSLPNDFPLERVRLVQLTTMIPVFVFATFVFGFGIGPSTSLALPLMAQFVIGYSSAAVLNLNNTLTVDLYPGKGASATAVNNLARCLLGAVGVSLTNIALERVRPHIFVRHPRLCCDPLIPDSHYGV